MIKGWADRPRIPRLGTIALGVKTENGAPKAVDHFVVPPEVAQVYGPEPKELDVMFPSDDLDVVLPNYFKRYGKQTGLICRGDNEVASLKLSYAQGPGGKEYGIEFVNGACVLKATGETLSVIVSGNKKWVQIPCSMTECPFFKNRACRPITMVNVLLPKVPRVLGVYTITTSSWNSYQNILNSLRILEGMAGRIRFLPAKLRVVMQEAHPELEGGKSVKTTVPVLMLDLGKYTLQEVIAYKNQSFPLLPQSSSLQDVGIVEDNFEEKAPDLIYPDEAPTEAPTEESDAADQGVPWEPPADDVPVADAASQDPLKKHLQQGKPKEEPPAPEEPAAGDGVDAGKQENQLEFTATRNAQRLPTKGNGQTVWVQAKCTFGALQGRVVDVFVDPRAARAIETAVTIVQSAVFAVVPDRVIGNKLIASDVRIISGAATAAGK